MKWMKHMTATWNDEKISRLVAAHGMAGYGLWWRVLEIVAARIEGDAHPTVTYPVTTWSHLLSLRGSHVRQALLKLHVTDLVTVECTDADIRVTIPNLLKYRDEYSRKAGHSPDTVRSKNRTEGDKEGDTDTEKENTPKPPEGGFASTRPPRKSSKNRRSTDEIRKALGERLPWWEGFWGVYPCHEGMNPAMDAYERKVHDRELAVKIYSGAKAYAAMIEQRRKTDPATPVKYGQGWLNDERWKDEMQPVLLEMPKPARLDPVELARQSIEAKRKEGIR